MLSFQRGWRRCVAETLEAMDRFKARVQRPKGSYLLIGRSFWAASTAAIVTLVVGITFWHLRPKESQEVSAYDNPGHNGLTTAALPAQGFTNSSAGGIVAGVAGGVPQPAQPPAPTQFIAGQLIEAGRPLIARTAEMSVTTRDFDRTRSEVTRLVNAHSGYLAQLAIATPSDEGRRLNATLRIPAGQLDGFLSELRTLGRVQSESQSGEEVTEQYIDLTARLKNAWNAEERLTDILRQRTGRLADILAVEEQIDQTRGEIERMEAEMKNLSTRIALATITLQVSEEYNEPLRADHGSTSGRLRNAAVEGYRSVINGAIALMVFLLAYGPGVLIAALILFFPSRALLENTASNSPSGGSLKHMPE